MVSAEAADEIAVGDDAVPALADKAGTGEGGGLWREAEKDLGEDVIVVWQLWRQGAAAAADTAGTALHREGFEMW
jgi:hypothetical protein